MNKHLYRFGVEKKFQGTSNKKVSSEPCFSSTKQGEKQKERHPERSEGSLRWKQIPLDEVLKTKTLSGSANAYRSITDNT